MSLNNQKVLILVANTFEDLELHYPKIRLTEEGAEVVVAGAKAKEIYKGKYGVPCQADISFDDVNVADYSCLIIPGGYAPDKLRVNSKVLEITKQFHSQQKLIAFICHAGWVPISANVLKGIKCTSVNTIKDDMVNSGADWVDAAVVHDKHFVSSRTPKDLPMFCSTIIQALRHETAVKHH
jgi:protease I